MGRVLAGYGLALALILYTPVTEWLAYPLYQPPDALVPADAIVVLEAWASDTGELNESGVKRALHGAELYRSGVAPIVVLTGSRLTAARTESALEPMRRLLLLGGVPPQSLVIDDASSNTHDSAVFVGTLSRQRSWKRVALITDASHMRRARGALRKEGVEVLGAPTLVWGIGGAQPSLRLARVEVLAHEYLGLAYYWWKDWI